MKTNENQKSTNHQPAAQKPFFGAGTEHAFFSAERAASTPFFQPKAVSPSALQAKSATSEAEGISQPVVQRMPAFESEVNDNREVQRSLFNSPQQLSASPIQAKLTIGEPGNQYEQEADRVASQVVGQINAPASAPSTQGRSVQRQEEQPEELQAKSEITALQRQEEKPEELQAKSILQRAIAGGEVSTDLTSAINNARGGGQPLDAGLQRSMGQAMGADFSGVRVHTNTQSDQLNQSIQAKAFTTGQDVFFRQGAYEPGSRGGQELIAHELTHVVQQSGVGEGRPICQVPKPISMIREEGTPRQVMRDPYPPGLANGAGVYNAYGQNWSDRFTANYKPEFYPRLYSLRKETFTGVGQTVTMTGVGKEGAVPLLLGTQQLDHNPSWNIRKDKILEYAAAMTWRLKRNALTTEDIQLNTQKYYLIDPTHNECYPTKRAARMYYNDFDTITPSVGSDNASGGAKSVQQATSIGQDKTFAQHLLIERMVRQVFDNVTKFQKDIYGYDLEEGELLSGAIEKLLSEMNMANMAEVNYIYQNYKI